MQFLLTYWQLIAAAASIVGGIWLTGRYFGRIEQLLKGILDALKDNKEEISKLAHTVNDHGERISTLEGAAGVAKKAVVLLVLLLPTLAMAGNWTPRMESLARRTEAKYHLPHGACRAFALQESTYDSNASRVETGYFNIGSRYFKNIDANSREFLADRPNYKIPIVAERAQRSISHGMFQVMGENYRAMGYYAEFIDPTLEEQFEYFGIFLSDLIRRHQTFARAVSAYNTGSPNKTYRSYVKRVTRFQQQFSY